MGRAIDMENDISSLKIQVRNLRRAVKGVIYELDSLSEKSTKTKKVDLVDDVKTKEEKNDGKKKADSKGNGKRNKSSDKADGDDNSKSK